MVGWYVGEGVVCVVGGRSCEGFHCSKFTHVCMSLASINVG